MTAPPENDATKEAALYSIRTPEEYLQTRVAYKINAYRTKGDQYRRWYLRAASLAVIGAAAVPVLINLDGVPSIYPTLFSLLVTVLVGLEGILHNREHWKNYDLMKSFLRQEAFMFQAGAGAYRGKTSADAFVLLVERVEEEIAKERAQTIYMRTARTTDQEPKPDSRQSHAAANE